MSKIMMMDDEEIKEELDNCNQKLADSMTDLDKEYWTTFRDFYQGIKDAKERYVSTLNPFANEAEKLYYQVITSKISTEDSIFLIKKAIVELERA